MTSNASIWYMTWNKPYWIILVEYFFVAYQFSVEHITSQLQAIDMQFLRQ